MKGIIFRQNGDRRKWLCSLHSFLEMKVSSFNTLTVVVWGPTPSPPSLLRIYAVCTGAVLLYVCYSLGQHTYSKHFWRNLHVDKRMGWAKSLSSITILTKNNLIHRWCDFGNVMAIYYIFPAWNRSCVKIISEPIHNK